MGVGTTIKNILTSDSDKRSVSSTNDSNYTDTPTRSRMSESTNATSPGSAGGVGNKVTGNTYADTHPRTTGPGAASSHISNNRDVSSTANGNSAVGGTRAGTGDEIRSGTNNVGGTRTTTGDDVIGRDHHHNHHHNDGTEHRHRTGTAATGAAAGVAGELEGREPVTGSRTGDFANPHSHGHHNLDSADIMPKTGAQETSHQLNPLTHERVRHVETEEVERHKEHHRNVHHVQHHVVPVSHHEEREEQHHNKVHPVTKVNEKHASKDEDVSLLNSQVHHHKDKIEHAPTERTVIDKGTIVDEKVHHHIHHVVQPIVKKETVDQHRIHTVIPSHETTHEAPIIHESVSHAPIAMDKFLADGGLLSGKGIFSHKDIGNQVLHDGGCEREVDGVGEKLARELHLGNESAQTAGARHNGTTGAADTRTGTGAVHNNGATNNFANTGI